jgi:hypothetical protein
MDKFFWQTQMIAERKLTTREQFLTNQTVDRNISLYRICFILVVFISYLASFC